MKYRLSDPTEVRKAADRLAYLVSKEKVVNITEVQAKRTLSQNRYLHLLLGAFGLHFGYTVEESKQIYKSVNKLIYRYKKGVKGAERTFYRSSADLNKDEMAITIDKFMKVAAEQGCTLPLATDQNWLMEIENRMEQTERYL